MTKIKNKRQLAASKVWLGQFRSALKVAKKNPANLHPRLLEAELDGMRSQIRDLDLEIKQYEELEGASPEEVVLASLDDLPEALVRMRSCAV